MAKNVLLMCLSPAKAEPNREQDAQKQDKKTYKLCNDEFEDCYLTNEAPAKDTIVKLDRNNEHLDEIIVILSDRVCEHVITDANRAKVLKNEDYMNLKNRVLEKDKKRFEELTHVELFGSLISHFSKSDKVKEDYTRNPIVFKPVYISDDPNGAEITSKAVEAAKYLEDENVNLYIDHNGGQRYIAFMLVAIANLAKVRGVTVKEILTMNYEKGQIVTVRNMNDVFECIDLVSGIHEYINYGRTRILNTYFEGCNNKDITDALGGMEDFSHAMQLCDTKYIMDKRKDLKQNLKDCKQKIQKRKDIHEVLFSYVIDDILDGYEVMFEGDLPEIITWCIDNDYIQQALTLYAERMPYYFWIHGIFKPTKDEKAEYAAFRTYCQEHLEDDIPMVKDYKKYYIHYYKEYSWIISFLLNSNYKYKKNYPTGRLMFRNLYRKNIVVSISDTDKIFFEEANPEDKETVTKIEENVDKLLNALAKGRAESILKDYQIKKVLINYFIAKELRNTFNHADAKRSNKIRYKEVCNYVKEAMKALSDFVEEKKSKGDNNAAAYHS